MAWIITSSARVEQYCGYIYKANSANSGVATLLLASGLVLTNPRQNEKSATSYSEQRRVESPFLAVYPTAMAGCMELRHSVRLSNS